MKKWIIIGFIFLGTSSWAQNDAKIDEVLNGMYLNPGEKQIVEDYKANPPPFHAKNIIRNLSTAAENYAAANNMFYPEDSKLLVSEMISPFLKQDSCGTVVDGFRITCELSSKNYKFTATSEENEMESYSISTGGIQDY
jgi:hypothetical protein